MTKPKLLVFASGTKDGGGSGMQNLIEASYDGRLDAQVVAVVCNIAGGGVVRRLSDLRAKGIEIPFEYAPKGARTPQWHEQVVRKYAGDDYWVALSGCLWRVPMKESPDSDEPGLDPRRVFNIHPALLSQFDRRFGGDGMHGHHVHEAMKQAFDAGEIAESGFSMHFVTNEYDRGPVIYEHRVPLVRGMTADEIGKAVNVAEHAHQPRITNEVIHGRIYWDGRNPASLVVPENLRFKM